MINPMRVAGLVLILAATGCVPTSHPTIDPSRPPLDPVVFFFGSTRGTGVLRIAFHRREGIMVEGTGRPDGADTIVLDQTVRRGDRAPTHRRWRLTRTAPGRYIGSLSDAVGLVSGEVHGNRLHLSFPMKRGLSGNQWLVVQPGGCEVRNIMVVTKLGLPVARLDETIVRLQSARDHVNCM